MSDFEYSLDGLEEIEKAISKGDHQTVESLLKSGRLETRAIWFALARAINAENCELVRTLVLHGKVDLNEQEEGSTWLRAAIENGSPEVVRELCKLGADPNLVWEKESGRRPLHLAVDIESMEGLARQPEGFDTDFTRALLEAGADPLLTDVRERHAIDVARGCLHKNAVHLMEQFVGSQLKTRLGELKTSGVFDGEVAATDPVVVVIVNCESGEDASPLALSVNKAGEVVFRNLGSTVEEAWLLIPNFVTGAERPGYSLVNRASRQALEQPNPSDEVILGEAPRLKLGDVTDPFGSKRFLWSLRPVCGGDEEQLWAIQDHKHAYSLGSYGSKIADGAPVFLWAWSGKGNQRWRIQRLGGGPGEEAPLTGRWSPWRRGRKSGTRP